MSALSYITRQIRTMCARFPGRTGGSEAEAACQAYIADELSACADSIEIQPLSVHPDAGWAWLAIAATCGIASVALPLIDVQSMALTAISFALMVIAALVVVVQFLMGYRVIDKLLPEKQGHNVYATVRPEGEVRQRIVFAGHADAAYEMTYAHQGGAQKLLRVALTSAIALVVGLILSAVFFIRQLVAGSMAIGGAWHWIRVFALLLLPLFIEALFFFDRGCVVDGANDNLSGCAVAMAALRELSRPGNRLAHTEVCCLTTSSEECGLRGAAAFGEAYAADPLAEKTIFIVLDTLHDIRQLKVYPRGMNGFQSNSEDVAALIRFSAQEIGISIGDAEQYLGATDAEALSRCGLKACALCGVDHTPQPYYHTRADTADNIDENCLGTCLALCLEVARQFDGKWETGEDWSLAG